MHVHVIHMCMNACQVTKPVIYLSDGLFAQDFGLSRLEVYTGWDNPQVMKIQINLLMFTSVQLGCGSVHWTRVGYD